MPAIKVKFRSRWKKQTVAQIVNIFRSRPINEDELAGLAGRIANEDGVERIDLRAFPFPENISNFDVERIDFSYSDLPIGNGLTSVSARNCLFRKMGIEYSLATSFVDCDFRGSRLIGIRGTPGKTYTRCNFSECHFAKGDFLRSRFEDCQFNSSRMPTTEFVECEFIRCCFTGVTFKRGNFGGSRFQQLRNNFKYLDHETVTPKEYVADPEFPTLDLHDTYMIDVTFE